MKKIARISLFILSITMGISCTPKVTSYLVKKNLDPIPITDSIYIIELGDTLTKNSIWVGKLYIGNNMTSKNCTMEEELVQAREAIRKHGANVGKLFSIEQPDPTKKCYKLCLDIYSVNKEDLKIVLNQDYECQLDNNANYANIYFYHSFYLNWNNQPANRFFNKIKIYDHNQKEYCQLSSGFSDVVKTTSFGPQNIILFDSNIRREFDVDIQKGCEYYFEVKYEFANKYKLTRKLTLTDVGVKNGRILYKKYKQK